MELKTTRQVAEAVKRTCAQLHLLLFRYPKLKPAHRLPTGGYLWTEEEIQRVVAHRASHQRGRPKKKIK